LEDILNIVEVTSVVKGSRLSDVFESGAFFVVDHHSLLLALKDLVVLLELLVTLEKLVVRHFSTDIASDLSIIFVSIQLSLNLSLSTALSLKIGKGCVVLRLQIV